MDSSEKELEELLKDVGNMLLNPPSSIDELLNLLDRLEYNLSKVEQSPSRLMQDALLPSMKALIANELLRHLDTDVKVSVVSCISEITRITAPDAPYDDEQMKEIFQLTVAAFEKLSHESSRCYSKAVSILDSVAKVRSCLVMLDLECDALVIEMFQNFLKIIRSNHPDAVFSDMESIMTLVLEESENISLELLSTLLDSVKKENQNVLPMSWKLGKRVIKNCAAKLKPYLMEAVQSMGITLNDYAQIVTSICQDASDTLEQNHVNGSGEHLVDENKKSEGTDPDEQSQVARELAPGALCPGEEVGLVDYGSKSMPSSDTAQTKNGDTFVDGNPLKKLKRCRRTKQSKSTDARGNNEPDNLDSMKAVKSEIESETVPKKRGRRPNSLMNPEEGYDHSWIHRQKKDSKVTCCRKYRDKVIDSSPSVNPVSKEAVLSSAHEKENEPQVFSPKMAHSETKAASLPSSNHRPPEGSHPNRGRRKKQGSMMNQDADQNSLSVPKGVLSSDQVEDKDLKPAIFSLKKESEHKSGVETKPLRRSRKKAITAKTSGKTSPASGDVVLKKENPCDFEEKPLSLSIMSTGGRDINEKGSLVQQTVGKKRSRGKAAAGKDISKESGDKKMVAGSTSKSSNENENHLDETLKKKSKRKRTPVKEEASDTPHSVKGLDEQLIGSRIKVWWPKDKMFYEGVIDSFDRIKKKHKVLYADGDEEILNLRKQRWELIGNDLLPDEGTQADLPNYDASSDMQPKEKIKIKLAPLSKQKASSSSKRSGASTSRPVDGSSLDNSLIVDNMKDHSFEMDGKVEEDDPISKGKLEVKSLEIGNRANKMNVPRDFAERLFKIVLTGGKKRHRVVKKL